MIKDTDGAGGTTYRKSEPLWMQGWGISPNCQYGTAIGKCKPQGLEVDSYICQWRWWRFQAELRIVECYPISLVQYDLDE